MLIKFVHGTVHKTKMVDYGMTPILLVMLYIPLIDTKSPQTSLVLPCK